MSEQPAPYIVAGENAAVRTCVLLAPDDAARLCRCEAWPVIGCEGMVDVRMDRALWERVRDAARGEDT
jgi:hypothetical protein